MYKIKIYDSKESLKHFPKDKRYMITFDAEHSIYFSNKREAFNFISKFSGFLSESLHMCEMFHNSLNIYKSLLETSSPIISDYVNVYFSNDIEIYNIIKEIKFFKWIRKEMYNVIRIYRNLLYLIEENVNIICKKINKNTNHLKHFIKNFINHFFSIIENVEKLYKENQLTLFIN